MQKIPCFTAILLLITAGLAAQNPSGYLLNYSSFFGGNHFEQARDLAVDQDGFVYITGGTSSPNFPTTPGAYNQVYNNAGGPTVGSWGPMMVFVSKFSPTGQLVWSTLLGGPNYDRAYAIEVDKDGYVYVGGRAGADFPTTTGVVQQQFKQQGGINNLYGHQNGFIAKIAPDGSHLIWSTYYGSDSYGFFRDIDIDDDGYVYGVLNAVKTPPVGISPNGFDPTYNGNYDIVAVKFSPDATAVEWATFLGGAGDDQGGPTIRVGPDKSVYVAGSTKSANYPLTTNAIQTQRKGTDDMYISRIAPDGSGLIYSTYFGGSGSESSETHCLFVDHLGQAYVACSTGSNDIPTTPGALKAQRSGTDVDGLFFKLSTDGSQLLACTYFGGLGTDAPEGLYVDSMQQLYVGGGSVSDDLPVTTGAFQTQRQGGSDGFVVKLDTAFSTALLCTYFGGSKNESVRAFHLGNDGTICLSGQTLSTNLPHTTNAFQTVHGSPNNNREDSYLAMFGLSALSGTSAADSEPNIQVYPNPATTQLIIDPAGARIQYFELRDGYGRLLKRFEDPGNSMDVQSLPSGLYWIRISLEGSGFVVKKWVKA